MYLIVVLAITVQVTVCGQTPGSSIPVSNALLPVVKHQQLIVSAAKTAPAIEQQLVSSNTSKDAQQIEAFKNRIETINKQITELESLKSQVNIEISNFFVQSVPVAADALNIDQVGKAELRHVCQLQADELYNQSTLLRQQARTKTGNSKNEALFNAAQLEALAIAKQIEASILSGRTSLEKFNTNNEQIEQLMRNWYGSQSKLEKAGEIIFDAKHSMRMAVEMREEANTYPHPSARLGAMQNAEEKEFLALSQQNEVLSMFGGSICSN
jgi:hypothetical protein